MKIRWSSKALVLAIGISGVLFVSGRTLHADPIVVSGCGDIAPRIAEFASLLGYEGGINWDGGPPSNINTNTWAIGRLRLFTEGSGFRVSDRNFSELNPSYSSQFEAYSSPNTIAPIGSNRVFIYLDGPVRGFGIVFSDVDRIGSTFIEAEYGDYDVVRAIAPPRCGKSGHSFVGVIFGDRSTAYRVDIVAGDAPISASAIDVTAGGSSDLVVIDDVFFHHATPGVARDATKVTFPIIARTSGAAGTNFRTELTLVNQTTTPADVLLQFHRWQSPWDYNVALWTEELTLAAGEQRVLDDVLKSQFGFDDSHGALQLFSEGAVTAVARIYNDQRAANRGTFAQYVNGISQYPEDPYAQYRTNGVLPSLSDSPIGAGPYRTNIGLFNDGPSTANVTLRALGVDGSLLSTSTLTVGALESSYPTAAFLFPDLGVREDFYVTYETDVDTLYVYASVVDNVNGDAIYVPAQVSSFRYSAPRRTFPVVARSPGANGTNYTTDVNIVSTYGDSTVLLEYYPGGGSGNASPSLTRLVSVTQGQELVLDDVLRNLFDIDRGMGALQITATRPVSAVARIYNDQRAVGQGTFGQFVDAALEPARERTDGRGLLPALSHSAGPYRTNIGWFNGGASDESVSLDANLSLRAFDLDGTLLSTATIRVPAYSQRQESVAVLFPDLGPRENFYVEYSTDVATRLYVYASVVDNVNGDAIYVPAQ